MTAAEAPGTGRRRRGGPRALLLPTSLCLVAAAVAASCSLLSRPGSVGPVRLEAMLTVSKDLDWVGPLAFSPDGKTLAALGMVTAYLYDAVTHRQKGTWRVRDTRRDAPTSLAFSPDGKTLIISDTGAHSAFVWNVAAQRVTTMYPNPRNAFIYNTALSSDGRLMAESSDWAGHTYLWSMVTQRYTGELTDPDFGVDPLAFSPDGATLAVGNGAIGHGKDFGQIALWNIKRRTIRATYQSPEHGQVQAVTFSRDGALLAATGIRSIYLWHPATGQSAGTLAGPQGAVVRDIAFSPDGRMLAAIFTNNAAYIWNLRTGKIVAVLPDPGNTEIASLAYSPDGKTLAVGDFQSHIFLWDVSRTDQPARSRP